MIVKLSARIPLCRAWPSPSTPVEVHYRLSHQPQTDEQKQQRRFHASLKRPNTSSKVVPAIYEIVENATDDTERPTVTRIENITDNASAQEAVIALKNGVVVANAASGINTIEAFDLDGRKLYSQSLQGAKQATLPLVNANNQSIIVKVTLTNGTSQSFKVMK